MKPNYVRNVCPVLWAVVLILIQSATQVNAAPIAGPGGDTNDTCMTCPCPPGVNGGGPHGGTGGGEKLGSGGCSSCTVERAVGMPQWSVTEPYINLWVKDTPLGYQPAKGPAVSLDLAYKLREDTVGFSTNEFSVGKRWNCSWLSYLATNGAGGAVHFSEGGMIGFATTNETEFFTNTRLEPVDASTYRVVYADGRTNVYGMSATVDGNQRFYLTRLSDRTGQALRLDYENQGGNPTVVRLLRVIDADGRTNTIQYAAPGILTNLITSVVDAFGRTASFGYYSDGRLSNVVDVAGLASSFVYGTNNWITNLITPYGTNVFMPGENVTNGLRSLAVTDAGGGRHLWVYQADLLSIFTGSPPTFDIPDFTMSERAPYLYNSFYWGPRQCPLLTHTNELLELTAAEYLIGRRKHWLGVTGNTALSMEQDFSPDGTTGGQQTWFDYTIEGYSVTQIQPLMMMRLLPNAETWFTRTDRNEWGSTTNTISSYSLADGSRGFRTNVVEYSTDGHDLLSHIGPEGTVEAGYFYNADHQVLRSTNALQEVTFYTYNTDKLLTSVKSPAGLTTTNIYFATGSDAGRLDKTIDLEIFRTNSYTYANGLVFSHKDERGMATTNLWDALQRLRRVTYPDGTFITNIYDKLDVVKVIDRLGLTNSFGYDPMQRRVAATNALGRYTHYVYCTCGSLDSVEEDQARPAGQRRPYG